MSRYSGGIIHTSVSSGKLSIQLSDLKSKISHTHEFMKSLINIEYTSTPESEDVDFLTQQINQETPEFGEARPFAFFIRDKKNRIIAGCNGSVIFGSIYTDQLWVDPGHRSMGLGHQLMEGVHDYGRKSGCSMATVATMSFQGAKSFYEKLGYVSDFERLGYTQNSSCFFLKRSL